MKLEGRAATAHEPTHARLYTAVDLARYCRVDLKTIHNWARKNAVFHHRTRGRHLRFYRLDVIDFLRAYGYPVPDDLRAARPRVILAYRESPEASALKRTLARRIDVLAFDDAYDALVSLATASPEALVLDAALLGEGTARCIARLRTNDATRHIRVIVIGDAPDARAAFIAAGATAHVQHGDPVEAREAIERIFGHLTP